MSGLVPMRESKDSGTQRSGRAARQGPGTAYRCLSQADWAGLPEHTPAEVTTSDLTSAVLALAVWGGDESLLPEPLPAGHRRQAIDTRVALGAVEDADAGSGDSAIADLTVTDTGRAIAAIPASVWSARGLLDGASLLSPTAAAEAVAVIESDQRAPGADLTALARQLRRSKDARFAQDRKRFAALAAEHAPGAEASDSADAASADDLGLVTALSFPLQIARLRSASDSEYLLASGTAAGLPRDSSLQGSDWLAISEVGLAGSRAIIRSAAPIDQDTAELAGAGLLLTEDTAELSDGKDRAVRRRTPPYPRSEEHTSELQSRGHLVCRLLLEKKKNNTS